MILDQLSTVTRGAAIQAIKYRQPRIDFSKNLSDQVDRIAKYATATLKYASRLKTNHHAYQLIAGAAIVLLSVVASISALGSILLGSTINEIIHGITLLFIVYHVWPLSIQLIRDADAAIRYEILVR